MGDSRRDKALISLDKLGDQVNHGLGVEVRKSNAGRGSVQTSHVLVGTEETNVALLVLVGLHTLETLKGIVEDTSGRVEREVLVRSDTGSLPAVVGCPFERQHVVGEVFAKDQFIVGDQFLGRRRLGDGQLGSIDCGQLWI